MKKFLFSGSENAASNANVTQNVFGSGLKFLPSAQSQTVSLFGNAAAGNKGTLGFNASGSANSGSGGLFSRTQQSNAASTSFSFSSPPNSHSSSSLFGTKPTSKYDLIVENNFKNGIMIQYLEERV